MSDKAFIYYSPEANEFFIIEDSNGFINYESETIGVGTPGNLVLNDNFNGGSYHQRSRCAVDENGFGVLVLSRYDTGTAFNGNPLAEDWFYIGEL